MQKKILEIWAREEHQLILWLPVLFGLGIGIYFLLPNEPEWKLLAVLAIVSIGIIHMRRLALIPALILSGLTLAAWHTAMIDSPMLQKKIYGAEVQGKIERIEMRETSARLILTDLQVEMLEPEARPDFLTVSLRKKAHANGLNIGDIIQLRAGFFPPPLPALPGGYQFNRHFFFERIGGVGYSMQKEPPLVIRATTEAHGFNAWLTALRLNISRELLEKLGENEGAVASALMVGESKAIPESVREAMRQAGLAHVLAISGMHLGLAAGIFFFLVRFVLAMIPSIALRYNTKKLAAIFALMGALSYLLIAGMPISAIRSYVMVALVLSAVLLDRMVTPMRSLALAALVLLCFDPHAILSPSFQLSFAATLGILAYYEHWRKREFDATLYEALPRWRIKIGRFFGAIIITSTAATLATMPFVLHHFDDFPTYSLLGNLLVMPIMSFIIMPLIVAALLLLPLGMSHWVMALLGWGIDAMISLAAIIASLPFSVISPPPLETPALILIILSGLWLCLWQQSWRWLGVMGIFIGMGSLFFYTPPDLIFSPDGKKQAMRSVSGDAFMLRGAKSGFTQDQWKRFLRIDEYHRRSEMSGCDDHACIFAREGAEIAVVKDIGILEEECSVSNVVLIIAPSLPYPKGMKCAPWVVDKWQLYDSGGMIIRLNEGRYEIETVHERLGNRPWNYLTERNKF